MTFHQLSWQGLAVHSYPGEVTATHRKCMALCSLSLRDEDSVYVIPALVTVTKQIFPGSDNASVPTEWLTGLAGEVRVVLGEFQYTQGAVAHVGVAQTTVYAALFSTRNLNDELRHMIMHRNTL